MKILGLFYSVWLSSKLASLSPLECQYPGKENHFNPSFWFSEDMPDIDKITQVTLGVLSFFCHGNLKKQILANND